MTGVEDTYLSFITHHQTIPLFMSTAVCNETKVPWGAHVWMFEPVKTPFVSFAPFIHSYANSCRCVVIEVASRMKHQNFMSIDISFQRIL